MAVVNEGLSQFETFFYSRDITLHTGSPAGRCGMNQPAKRREILACSQVYRRAGRNVHKVKTQASQTSQASLEPFQYSEIFNVLEFHGGIDLLRLFSAAGQQISILQLFQ
jgi:hypothetical protein